MASIGKGIGVAVPLPFKPHGAVAICGYQYPCRWLADKRCERR